MRSSTSHLLLAGGLAVFAALLVAQLVVPSTSAHAVELRPWLVARAAGVVGYLLLATQVGLGLVLSHPTNQTVWKLSKRLFGWHELLTVFVWAFLGLHVALLIVDPYADVGLLGALVPGFAGYRAPAIALGTIAVYALLITAVTARWTRLLPRGAWVSIHRLAALVFAASWAHGVLAGTDTASLSGLYLVTGLPILAGVVHRWWVIRVRPTRAAHPATGRAAVAGAPAVVRAAER
jgi:hypothetical protein